MNIYNYLVAVNVMYLFKNKPMLHIAIVCVFNGLPVLAMAEDLFPPVRVIDGDTLELAGERHRLRGIDAPESVQMCKRSDGQVWACGNASAFALYQLIKNKAVHCEGQKRDYYKRRLSECFVDDMNINAWMVLNGWAFADVKYGSSYQELEQYAEKEKRGVWAGSFVFPWVWRKQKYAP